MTRIIYRLKSLVNSVTEILPHSILHTHTHVHTHTEAAAATPRAALARPPTPGADQTLTNHAASQPSRLRFPREQLGAWP